MAIFFAFHIYYYICEKYFFLELKFEAKPGRQSLDQKAKTVETYISIIMPLRRMPDTKVLKYLCCRFLGDYPTHGESLVYGSHCSLMSDLLISAAVARCLADSKRPATAWFFGFNDTHLCTESPHNVR